MARLLRREGGITQTNMFAKKKGTEEMLQIRTVDVDKWRTLSEVQKVQLLNSLLPKNQVKKSASAY